MELAKQTDTPFTWLTITNAGSAQVCKAALRTQGVSEKDLESGYPCDPNTKSDLRIIAKPGLTIRLSRNFDKQRGFVNGAIATSVESLDGNRVFTARLLGTGNMVLLHPMEENGQRFLPCCYGYATTIRRAQGADLLHGCIYMDNKKFPAVRGYGYVAVSRFKSRQGVYMFGKLRRSDFLPVGPEQEHEITERGYYSLESDDDEGRGLEYAHSDQSDQDVAELGGSENMLLAVDFGNDFMKVDDPATDPVGIVEKPIDLGKDYEAYVSMSCATTSDEPPLQWSDSVDGEDYNLLQIDFM